MGARGQIRLRSLERIDNKEPAGGAGGDWALEALLVPHGGGDWPLEDKTLHFVAAGGGGGGRRLIGGWSLDMGSCGADGYMPINMWALTWARFKQAGGAIDVVAALVDDGAGPLGAGAALRVPAPGGLSAQQFFSGPFSDVAVVCGGSRFDVHRVVLASASPVFLSMLSSEMAEGGGAPEVEIRETDPAALELLLRHAYGAAVDVSLALAPQLCGLADRFQLHTDLAEQLQLWLSTVDVQPAALCELLPDAHTLCPYTCKHNLYERAAAATAGIMEAPAFSSWPVELVVEVMRKGNAALAFTAAVAWMAARPCPAEEHHRWPALLDAVWWSAAREDDLQAIRAHGGAAGVPGLQERLLDACDELCRGLRASAATVAAFSE